MLLSMYAAYRSGRTFRIIDLSSELEVVGVIECDPDEGWRKEYLRDADGNLVLDGGEPPRFATVEVVGPIRAEYVETGEEVTRESLLALIEASIRERDKAPPPKPSRTA